MPMKARYTVLDGEILAQERSSLKHDYVPDPLGSVVALYDTNQTKTDTFSYWPYGEEKSRTGTTPTSFRFGGTVGYYADPANRYYIRAREYAAGQGKWLSVDRFWPHEDAYLYQANRPLTGLDREGFSRGIAFWKCYNGLVGRGWNPPAACRECKARTGSSIGCEGPPFGPPKPEGPSGPAYGWPDCMANCIEALDPMTAGLGDKAWIGQGLIYGLVGSVPKRPIAQRIIGRTIPAIGSPWTCGLSILTLKYELPPYVRRIGRYGNGLWIIYGNGLFILEAYCAAACARNPRAY